MHDLRMIHTDLKPENILLVSPEYVKVPDYKVLFFLPTCDYLLFWNCTIHNTKSSSWLIGELLGSIQDSWLFVMTIMFFLFMVKDNSWTWRIKNETKYGTTLF